MWAKAAWWTFSLIVRYHNDDNAVTDVAVMCLCVCAYMCACVCMCVCVWLFLCVWASPLFLLAYMLISASFFTPIFVLFLASVLTFVHVSTNLLFRTYNSISVCLTHSFTLLFLNLISLQTRPIFLPAFFNLQFLNPFLFYFILFTLICSFFAYWSCPCSCRRHWHQHLLLRDIQHNFISLLSIRTE